MLPAMLVDMSAVLTNAKYYIERIDGREDPDRNPITISGIATVDPG